MKDEVFIMPFFKRGTKENNVVQSSQSESTDIKNLPDNGGE